MKRLRLFTLFFFEGRCVCVTNGSWDPTPITVFFCCPRCGVVSRCEAGGKC